MTSDHTKHDQTDLDTTPRGIDASGFWLTRTGIALLAIGSISGLFLLSEHQTQVLAALPTVLLLGCLLMHAFIHWNHGKQGSADGHGRDQESQSHAAPDQDATKAHRSR